MPTLTIPGVPIAQPRQRYTKSGFNYTETHNPVNMWKAALAYAWHELDAGAPVTGPVRIECEFVLARPKTRPTRIPKPLWLAAKLWHWSKPDVDNMLKAVKDGLNKLAWNDDSQVCQVYAEKRYANADEQPHATITVMEV